MVEGIRVGPVSHLGTLQEEKINWAHTHTQGRSDSPRQSMTFKRKKLTLTPSLSPDCHKAAANIKTFFICAARGYWHQKLFSSPSAAGLLCRSPPPRPSPVTAASQHIGSWCEAIHVHLPLTESLSPSTLPLQQKLSLSRHVHIHVCTSFSARWNKSSHNARIVESVTYPSVAEMHVSVYDDVSDVDNTTFPAISIIPH